jgi:hypothetical protein
MILEEGEFMVGVKRVLDDYLGEGVVQFGVSPDLLYLSVLSLDLNKSNEELWKQLASDNKSEVDFAFRQLLGAAISSTFS